MQRVQTLLLLIAVPLLTEPPVSAQAATLQELGALAVPRAGETTVYLAREILTLDPERPRAEALAVRDGRFVAVGTRAEVEAAAGPGARLDRTFADKVVMAGFVEQHVHPVLAALTMNTRVLSIEDWDAIDGFSPAIRDEETYQRRFREAIAAHREEAGDETRPFVSWGYHHYFHGEMSRTLLDELVPDFPAVVWHRSCHEFFLNTRALELVGLDQAAVAGMSASAREQSSLERGHFFEQGALAIVDRLTPLLASPERFRAGLEFTETYYHRAGITLACEPGGMVSKPLQEAINAVYGDDATPFDHCFIADGKTFAARHPEDVEALITDTEQLLDWGSGRTWYLPKQVKLFSDGAIYSQLMMMRDGYTDGHHGAWLMDPPLFDHAFQSYWDAGYQIHVHNNGDAGLDMLLASLEKAIARNPRSDHRTVLVHFGFATAQQVARWGELGGIVSSNPYYVTALAGRYAEIGIGPERSRDMVPMGPVVGNDISFSFHSDMPMAPARPLQLVWAAVNRRTAEGAVAGPEHRVSLDAALAAVTREAAFSIRLEEEVGSIEVGKRANLTILEESPYEVPASELKEIAVWGTMLDGRIQPAPPAPQGARLGPNAAAVDSAAGSSELARAAGRHLAGLLAHAGH